ncbi:MAG: hypothetical protein HY921_09425 [Elusimicrobia bacterium]|nr:hypothetical protein [Elusimicrobiota bacterium]
MRSHLPLALICAAFLAVGAAIHLWVMPAGQLTMDEPFYYFQAFLARKGEFVWFADMVSVLYPIFLALFIGGSLPFLRFLTPLLFCSGAVVLFRLVLRHDANNRWGALCAAALLLFHAQTFHLSHYLASEALFSPLFFLVLHVFLDLSQTPGTDVGKTLQLGCLCGLLGWVRAPGFVISAWIGLWLLASRSLNWSERFKRGGTVLAIIAVMSVVPKLFHTKDGLTELTLKLAMKGPFFGVPLADLLGVHAPSFFGWGFLALLCAALVFQLLRGKSALLPFLLGMEVFFIVVTILLDRFFQPRHLFPLLMINCLLAGICLGGVSSKWRGFFAIGVVGVILQGLPTLARMPVIGGNSYYFVEGDKDAFEVKSLELMAPKGRAYPVPLPYFDQPDYTVYTYRARLSTASDFDWLFLSYISDEIKISIDGQEVLLDFLRSPFDHLLVPFHFKPGRHEIILKVRSNYLLNGIGQVLLVRRSFLDRRVRKYGPIRALKNQKAESS